MDIKEIKSDMEMLNFYFEKIEFARQRILTEGEMKINVDTDFSTENEKYIAKLTIKIDKGSEMALYVRAVGEFNFNSNIDNLELQQSMIETNAISIMFPFVRSQITLITAQPGMSPIVIPTVNILKLMEFKKKTN